MLQEVIINAVTEKGKDALKQHYEESKKLRNQTKLKAIGIKQSLVSENPYTIMLQIINKRLQQLLEPETFVGQIEKALEENGATKDDYTIGVK